IGPTTTDAAGNPLAPTMLDFFIVPGDIDRDRSVGFSDLVFLAQNYGGANKTYAQGDLTGDGKVDFIDLVLLAQNYGTTLAAPTPLQSATTSVQLAATSVPEAIAPIMAARAPSWPAKN